MTNAEIKENLIDFYSYDKFGFDFGKKDDELKRKTVSILEEMGEEQENKVISELLIENFLNENRVAEGYGWRAVKEFLEWYGDDGCYLD